MSTPTRRALHFFPCARLCAPFLASSTPHQNLWPLLCFAPLSSRWTLLSKVRVAICISIVVVHVGRRLRSLVQPSNVHSSICPRVHILRRFKCSGKVRRPQGSTRFSTSRRRPGPRDNHQEGRWRDKRAFRSLRLVFVALLLTHPRFRSRFSHLRAPKKRPSAPSSGVVIDASSIRAWWMKPKRRRGSQVRFLPLLDVCGAWHVP